MNFCQDRKNPGNFVPCLLRILNLLCFLQLNQRVQHLCACSLNLPLLRQSSQSAQCNPCHVQLSFESEELHCPGALVSWSLGDFSQWEVLAKVWSGQEGMNLLPVSVLTVALESPPRHPFLCGPCHGFHLPSGGLGSWAVVTLARSFQSKGGSNFLRLLISDLPYYPIWLLLLSSV